MTTYTYTHTTTSEQVTLIEEKKVHNGLGLPHVVLKRANGKTLTIPKKNLKIIIK
jgi:hypothetical protein